MTAEPDQPTAPNADRDRPPATLRAAVLLLRIQGAVLAVLAALAVYLWLARGATSVAFAVLTVGLLLGLALLSWALSTALERRRVRARAPAIVLELMLLYPVWVDLGAVRLVPAALLLAVCVLLVLPATNRALDGPAA